MAEIQDSDLQTLLQTKITRWLANKTNTEVMGGGRMGPQTQRIAGAVKAQLAQGKEDVGVDLGALNVEAVVGAVLRELYKQRSDVSLVSKAKGA